MERLPFTTPILNIFIELYATFIYDCIAYGVRVCKRMEAVWGKSWYFDAFKFERSENSKGWSLIAVMEESFQMESIPSQLKCLPFPVWIIFGFCFVASLYIIFNCNMIHF